jgi:hypothetical protein
MGFFKGKPKDKDAEKVPTGKSNTRRSIRTIAPGGKPTAKSQPAGGQESRSAPNPSPVPGRSSGSSAPPSAPVRPAAPAPTPAREPVPASRPPSKAPITASRPADFSDGGIASVRKAAGPARTGDAALIEFLKKVSLLDDEQSEQVKAAAARDGTAIDVAAVQLAFITEDKMVTALTQECWVPHLKVDRYEIRKKALDTISRDDAMHFGVFPVDKLGSLLTLAMVNPLDADTIRTLESKTSLDIKKVVATRSEINQVIEKYYSGAVQAKEGSLSITQDTEPKSVTQMLANVSSVSDKLPPFKAQTPVPAPMPPVPTMQHEIQDIDDLLSADEAIAPAIVEPISLKPEDIELIPEVVEAAPTPAATDFEFEDTAALAPPAVPARQTASPRPSAPSSPAFDFEEELAPTPAAKPPPKPSPLSPEFDDIAVPVQETSIIRPKAPAPKPPAPSIAPAPQAPAPVAAAQSGAPGIRPATSRFTSKAPPVRPGLINLVPVLEEEFQHAITHGKSHIFEKWVGLQTRNRIINAVAVEHELEPLLAGLYASPRHG